MTVSIHKVATGLSNNRMGQIEMSKFKVGDKVEYTIKGGRIKTTTVGEVKSADGDSILVDFEGVGVCHVSTYALKHSTPSPIRTVTATEIVAGKYGRIEIEAVTGFMIMRIIEPLRFHTAEDLRESSELLLKIADALDSGAKVVSK